MLDKELEKFQLPLDLNVGLDEINNHQLKDLLKVINNFNHLFASDPNNPGSVDKSVAVHTIDTGDTNPINQGPRRVSPQNRKIIKETIDKLLKAGIISPSRSPWASPVLLVPKKDTTDMRMCIDYRKH
jgi:hypothetical protein